MSEPTYEIAPYQPKELAVPFPLIQELFQEGEKTFGGAHNGSDSDYYDEESTARKPKLHEKFAALALGDDPAKYYFTYYDDRRSTYFAEGTRGRSACIATQERKAASNDRLREIIYSQDGSGFYMTVGENVNNRAFMEWQNADEEGLVQPSGRMQAKYRLIDSHKRELMEFTASRVDEVMFDKDGQSQPGRWTRSLRIDNTQQDTEYKELYIINRSKDIGQENRADVAFQFKDALDNPQSVTVAIGFGPPSYARTIAEDPEGKVRVVVYKGHEDELDILRQDPNYAFLNDEEVSSDKVLSLMRERIALLQQQWDKPQSVFAGNPQPETAPKQLER